ncbi:putative MFS family arabinose efflux permease [Lipingzhangella halophila]|uniref:Putative MFS family arabinose efflux permease n=1 Tax=Lipingzhangella halophila TaxID=1783352 RepID=A0A7W7RDF1_9ACTN|nr:hypothetical protein [Lipingzhangella halophila]MBB4929947.1 putative MFS family arabinose efflux permease [Lipingzhangella halophila]
MSTRPITIVLAAAVEAVVALALVAGGLYVLSNTLLGNAADASAAIPLAVLAFGAAGAAGYVAWGLFALREWARTPVLLTQIFVLVIAYYMGTSEQYAIAAALAVAAVAGAACVLAPSTSATLFPDEPGSRGRSNP